MKHLLLLSNSTNAGQPYLEWSAPHIARVLEGCLNPVFIPFAGVTISYDDYLQNVNEGMKPFGIQFKGLHHQENKPQAIEQADAIIIGGGNTFSLLSKLYQFDLIEVIRKKVLSGTPFVGWSAGSNMACPTLKTTNDMPIEQPKSFEALNLFPAQINPHYTDKTIEGHGGESRDMRIAEFLVANKEMKVLGLPEGCFLEVKDDKIWFEGDGKLKLFRYKEAPVVIEPSSEISSLLH